MHALLQLFLLVLVFVLDGFKRFEDEDESEDEEEGKRTAPASARGNFQLSA